MGEDTYKGFIVDKTTTAADVVRKFLDQYGSKMGPVPALVYNSFELRVVKKSTGKSRSLAADAIVRDHIAHSKSFGGSNHHFVLSLKPKLVGNIARTEESAEKVLLLTT